MYICDPSPVKDDAYNNEVFVWIDDTITALIAPKSTQPPPVPIVKEFTVNEFAVNEDINPTALLRNVVEPLNDDI